MVAVEPSSLSSLGISTVDQDLLKRTEKVLLAAPPEDGSDLATFHEVQDEVMLYQILKVDTLRPATTTVIYFVWVGR